jgi:putative hemolysin
LSRLRSLFHGMVEVGRSCTHPAYRNRGVMSMLWAGLAQFVLGRRFRYLMGAAASTSRTVGFKRTRPIGI